MRLTGLELLDLDGLYNPASFLLKPYRDETGKEDNYISCAKKEMNDFLGREVMQVPAIRDFFLMKDSEKIPPKARTRYMKLEAKEYKQRENNNIQLPTVESVVKGDKIQVPENKKPSYEHKKELKTPSGNKEKGTRGNNKKQKSFGSSGGSIGTSIGDLIQKKGIKVKGT